MIWSITPVDLFVLFYLFFLALLSCECIFLCMCCLMFMDMFHIQMQLII